MSALENIGKVALVSIGLTFAMFLVASLIVGLLVMVAGFTGHDVVGFLCGGAS